MTDRPMHTVPGLFARLEALYAQGEEALAERRFGDAVGAFSEGLALDDHFRQRWVTMYAQRAFALHNLGRLDDAADDYARAIAMGEPEPHRAQYHFQRGMCLEGLGRHEEAAAAYGESIALAPDQPGPRHLRGKLLAGHLERPDEALADFDAFLVGHDHPEVRRLRGWCLLQAGRPGEALPDVHAALAQAPDPWTHYLLAWATAATGDVDGCLVAMRATLAGDAAYAEYFRDLDDYAAVRADPRFASIVG